MADSQTRSLIEKLQENIELLESRNAFQDDIIEQLNHELSIHQQQLAELKSQIMSLATRIKENGHGSTLGASEVEPPPPHY